MAGALADTDSGLSDLRHPEHSGAGEACRQTEEVGGGKSLGSQEGLHTNAITPHDDDPGPTSWGIPLLRIFFSKNLALRDSQGQTGYGLLKIDLGNRP